MTGLTKLDFSRMKVLHPFAEVSRIRLIILMSKEQNITMANDDGGDPRRAACFACC